MKTYFESEKKLANWVTHFIWKSFGANSVDLKVSAKSYLQFQQKKFQCQQLTATAKYEFAMDAFLASMDHKGSDKSPTVADGLKTISAPFKPNIIQFWGWCLE